MAAGAAGSCSLRRRRWRLGSRVGRRSSVGHALWQEVCEARRTSVRHRSSLVGKVFSCVLENPITSQPPFFRQSLDRAFPGTQLPLLRSSRQLGVRAGTKRGGANQPRPPCCLASSSLFKRPDTNTHRPTSSSRPSSKHPSNNRPRRRRRRRSCRRTQ